MLPRNLHVWLLFLTAFHVCGRYFPAAAAASPPNIVIILCDDLGYGDLECYGHPTIKTPHLNQLASEGIRLTDCYSAAPICSPSRAGLLTGRTPTRSGIYSWIAEGNPMNLKKDETTLATLLKRAGYDTCLSGKWHLNGLFNNPAQTQPSDHGFDHWFSTQNNAHPSHENPDNFVRNGKETGPIQGYSCQIVVDEAAQWLRERQEKNRPFFLHICFHETHEPVASPDRLVQQYPEAKGRGEALYEANVTNMDHATGRLMKVLDELQIAENTLVFFTSDNGPETLNRYKNAWRSWGSPGPLRGMKLHMYDGGIRVPGILRWTGRITAGQTSSVPVSSVDLLPTICELAGIPLPTSKVLDGTSLVPFLSGKPIQRKKPLFWHYYGGTDNRQVALREGDWKLVAWWDQPQKMSTGTSLSPGVVPLIKKSRLAGFELYHISEDVSEQHNLAEQEPERLKKMAQQAEQFYAEVIKEGPYWFPEDRP